MSASCSSEIVTNLKRVVDAVSKSKSSNKTTSLQTSEIVKSLRLVLEDGLKGEGNHRPSIWRLLKRAAKLYPEEFGSSIGKVRATDERSQLSRQKREDLWIEQALSDGLVTTLLEKIQNGNELIDFYTLNAVTVNQDTRYEVVALVERLEGVLRTGSSSLDTVHLSSSGDLQQGSGDLNGRESSPFSRLWSWSRNLSFGESFNPAQTKSFTLEERQDAARLLLKELTDTTRRIIQQYSINKHPLSIQSYPLSKLCSLYEEAFSFGMRPCPLFRPSGPIKYLSDLEEILTKGSASFIALLYGLETLLGVRGLDVAKFRQLPEDDDEQFRIWLHSCLLDGSFAAKVEIVIKNGDFLQGWYYSKAVIIDEDLSQQLVASCHSIAAIEILPESPKHKQQDSLASQGEFSNNKDSVVEEKEEDEGLMFTAHEVHDESVPDSSEEQLTPLSSPHGGDTEEPVFQDIHEDQVFEDNCDDQISEDVDNDKISEDNHIDQISKDVDSEQVPEDINEDQAAQDIHTEQNLPVSTPFAAVAMTSPSTDESTDTPETIEEDVTPDTSFDQNAKLRAGDQARTSPNCVVCFTTEDEEEWSGVWKDIDVLRYEVKSKGRNDHYAVYVIEVMASDGTQWQTARRFSELAALRKTLSKKRVSLPHSWSNLSGAKSVRGKAKLGSDVLEARLVLFRQCLWDFKVAYPEALVWQPVSEFLDAPLSILKSTRHRQRHNLAHDAVLQDKFADRFEIVKQGMPLIVDLPTQIPDEVLFEIQHGVCPGCQGYLPSICHQKPMFKGSPSPRKCEYTELLYCHACHHLDTALLPSRVLHEWEFRKGLVSVSAKQYIMSMFPHPVLCINSSNPGLLASVPVLGHLQYLRLDIIQKLDTLRRKGPEGKRIADVFEKKAGTNVYLVQNADYWSLKDLGDISRSFLAVLPRWLEMLHLRISKIAALPQEQLS